MIKLNKLNKDNVTDKLIHTYPNAIAESDGILDYDETISNFAECIWRDFDTERQQYHFNTQFGSLEDCERWLRDNIDCLYETCQNFINSNNYQDND